VLRLTSHHCLGVLVQLRKDAKEAAGGSRGELPGGGAQRRPKRLRPEVAAIQKVDFRVGRVLEVQAVEGSAKLYRCQVRCSAAAQP
jgi:tRNA-binding EMAP/Myf-like protein